MKTNLRMKNLLLVVMSLLAFVLPQGLRAQADKYVHEVRPAEIEALAGKDVLIASRDILCTKNSGEVTFSVSGFKGQNASFMLCKKGFETAAPTVSGGLCATASTSDNENFEGDTFNYTWQDIPAGQYKILMSLSQGDGQSPIDAKLNAEDIVVKNFYLGDKSISLSLDLEGKDVAHPLSFALEDPMNNKVLYTNGDSGAMIFTVAGASDVLNWTIEGGSEGIAYKQIGEDKIYVTGIKAGDVFTVKAKDGRADLCEAQRDNYIDAIKVTFNTAQYGLNVGENNVPNIKVTKDEGKYKKSLELSFSNSYKGYFVWEHRGKSKKEEFYNLARNFNLGAITGLNEFVLGVAREAYFKGELFLVNDSEQRELKWAVSKISSYQASFELKADDMPKAWHEWKLKRGDKEYLIPQLGGADGHGAAEDADYKEADSWSYIVKAKATMRGCDIHYELIFCNFLWKQMELWSKKDPSSLKYKFAEGIGLSITGKLKEGGAEVNVIEKEKLYSWAWKLDKPSHSTTTSDDCGDKYSEITVSFAPDDEDLRFSRTYVIGQPDTEVIGGIAKYVPNIIPVPYTQVNWDNKENREVLGMASYRLGGTGNATFLIENPINEDLYALTIKRKDDQTKFTVQDFASGEEYEKTYNFPMTLNSISLTGASHVAHELGYSSSSDFRSLTLYDLPPGDYEIVFGSNCHNVKPKSVEFTVENVVYWKKPTYAVTNVCNTFNLTYDIIDAARMDQVNKVKGIAEGISVLKPLSKELIEEQKPQYRYSNLLLGNSGGYRLCYTQKEVVNRIKKAKGLSYVCLFPFNALLRKSYSVVKRQNSDQLYGLFQSQQDVVPPGFGYGKVWFKVDRSKNKTYIPFEVSGRVLSTAENSGVIVVGAREEATVDQVVIYELYHAVRSGYSFREGEKISDAEISSTTDTELKHVFKGLKKGWYIVRVHHGLTKGDMCTYADQYVYLDMSTIPDVEVEWTDRCKDGEQSISIDRFALPVSKYMFDVEWRVEKDGEVLRNKEGREIWGIGRTYQHHFDASEAGVAGIYKFTAVTKYAAAVSAGQETLGEASVLVKVGDCTENKPNYWLGKVSDDFFNPANWTAGFVPKKHDNFVFATEENNNGEGVQRNCRITLKKEEGSEAVTHMNDYFAGMPHRTIEVNDLVNESNKKLIIDNGVLMPQGRLIGFDIDALPEKYKDANARLVVNVDSVKAWESGAPYEGGSFVLNKTNRCGMKVFAEVNLGAPNKYPTKEWVDVKDALAYSPTKGRWLSYQTIDWRHIGVPVVEAKPEVVMKGSYVQEYHEDWNNEKMFYQKYEKYTKSNVGAKWLSSFVGYNIGNYKPKAIKGYLNFCDHVLTLTRKAARVNGVPAEEKWAADKYHHWGLGQNLFANSYTAPMDIKKMFEGADEKIEQTVYIYKHGDFGQWAEKGGFESDGSAGSDYIAIPAQHAGEDGLAAQILPMQGFMLKFTDEELTYNGDDAMLTLEYDKVVKEGVAPQSTRNAVRSSVRSADERDASMQMVLVGDSVANRVYLFEAAGTTKGFDNGWDAGDRNEYSTKSRVYAHSTDGEMQVSTTNSLLDQSVGVNIAKKGKYVLGVVCKNKGAYGNLHLVDLKERTLTPVKGDTLRYEIQANEVGEYPARFRFVNSSTFDFEHNGGGITAIDNVIVASQYGDAPMEVVVYNTKGQKVAAFRTEKGENQFKTRLPKGIYIIEGVTGGQRTSTKMFVR